MASSHAAASTPERRLLVCCAHSDSTDALAEQLRQAALQPLDWVLFLREADENGITPLIARHLSRFASQVPAAIQEQLQAGIRANAERSLLLAAELFKLLDLLAAQSILAIPYKGPVIAAQAYGDLALRQYADIDIIIRQRDVARVHALMMKLGFRSRTLGNASPEDRAIPGEYSYQDDERALIVEFHTEKTLRHFPRPPDLDSLAAHLVPVPLGARQVRTFAPEDGLTFLCVHGAKDSWTRLVWIADVAELIRSHEDLDWDRALHFAESLRADRMLRVGLSLASQLLDAPLPEEVRAQTERDAVACAFAAIFAQRQRTGARQIQSASARFHFRRKMVSGFFDGWRYALRLALIPAQDDFKAAPLPARLVPLQGLLRPFRLWKKYPGA